MLPDEMLTLTYHGINGVWLTIPAFNGLLAGFQLELGDKDILLARERTGKRMAEEENSALQKDRKALAWRAVWLPVISFVSGSLAASLAIIGGLAVAGALPVRR